jgi:leucyl/phenylalanyl-tRNA--protein transferase
VDIWGIVEGYRRGYFLMDNGEGLAWYSSPRHALIPLDSRFHIPASLRRVLNANRFEVRINSEFAAVVEGCAHAHRNETWISPELKAIYSALHKAGHAHSFETWFEGKLAGGILGISLGAAFIGESMFYQVPEASKVAMVMLVQHLRARSFQLFDAQIMNPHLARFGAYEVGEEEFVSVFKHALSKQTAFV